MKHTILLNDEELEGLGELITADISERRVELRRTRNPGFRDFIRHHIELEKNILNELNQAWQS